MIIDSQRSRFRFERRRHNLELRVQVIKSRFDLLDFTIMSAYNEAENFYSLLDYALYEYCIVAD